MTVFSCILKTLFCPIILPLQAFRIYILGCLGVYFERFFRGLCCGICVCCGCPFVDKQFPANASSIGPLNGKTAGQIEQEVEWQRVKKICARGGQQGAQLFSGKIEPADICQGQVGDCWLMSALACLAHVEGAIQLAFHTREYNEYGKYKIRLYDKKKSKFVNVTVDDWIPCKKGTCETMFAKPNGDEAWVLLLEKAMAKFMGSYHALDGGSTLWAFETLTGNYVFKFMLQPQETVWKRFDLVHSQDKQGAVMLQPSNDKLSFDEMFATVLYYTRKQSVVAASAGGGSDKENINGIVQGHAYSIISAKQVDNFQMVKLRNPWGSFEWQGNWSDKSPLWQQYPKVARALNYTDTKTDDGCFWMEFKDFCVYYKNLDFCFRTTGWDDMALDIHEESPCFGPCRGCVEGCCSFWFCCKGVRALCCANKQQSFQKAPQGCCASCAC